MVHNRRAFITQLVAGVGGAGLLAACGDKAEILPTNVSLTGSEYYSLEEYKLLTRMADIIIPRTETPGALDVGVPEMMDGLMTGWAGVERRKEQHKTLARIKFGLDDLLSRNFNEANDDDARWAMQSFDVDAFNDKTPFPEYRAFKLLIERVYALSEGGATEEYKNDPVPGHWDPRVPLSNF